VSFPVARPRRLRRSPLLRQAVAETRLAPADFILPIFVAESAASPVPIPSLPGQYQHTIESALQECQEAVDLGIPMVLLFGIPASKDDRGTGAWSDSGAVQRLTGAIKDRFGEQLLVATDLCMCEYTSHGHCGILRGQDVDNDATLDAYREIALSQARSGADVIAPSGMMDGQVGAIRAALGHEGMDGVAILAYSAKMASAFYGPFREAVDSAPAFGDRRAYQMDGGNLREALREVRLDVAEGADMVMVKPAGPYLDVIARVSDAVDVPLAAYQVSGEMAMLKAAVERGWLDNDTAVMESLVSIRRAGANLLISYLAKEAVRIMQGFR